MHEDGDGELLGLGFDFYELLKDRLEYIRSYYDAVMSQFEGRKRSIENQVEPYVDTRNPEDYDGPAFELEWSEANDFEHTTGFLCVSLLTKALENYLRFFVMREFGLRNIGELSSSMKAHSISYKNGKVVAFVKLLQRATWTKFSWSSSPITKIEVEDITLTRNAFMHDEQLDDGFILHKQFESHRQHSAFSDLRWAELYRDDEFWDNPQKLIVTRENFTAAIGKVTKFCEYIENCRTR